MYAALQRNTMEVQCTVKDLRIYTKQYSGQCTQLYKRNTMEDGQKQGQAKLKAAKTSGTIRETRASGTHTIRAIADTQVMAKTVSRE
jgi:hypothetical protein